MKRSILTAALLVGCMSLWIGGALAQDAGAKAAPAKAATAKAAMSKYLVISPHTPEECMKALDDVQATGTGALAKWDFGCMDGDHTGYLVVSAASSEDALKNVPEAVRDKAKAIKIHKFSAAELKAAHEKAKM